MDQHQSGQREALMEVQVDTVRPGIFQQPGSSRTHFKCIVVIAVMGFIIATMAAGFIFLYFTPCKQDLSQEDSAAKVNVTCELEMSQKEGRFDIFTPRYSARYQISGWVMMSNHTKEKVTLKMMQDNHSRPIEPKYSSDGAIIFFDEARLTTDTTVSMLFKGHVTGCHFHIYKL
ncbi:unnamed protein product [Ophioblennius macclurei]